MREQHPSVTPLIEVDAVSVSVGHETMLPPVSFLVRAGESVVLRGPNGAGKTTLLRVMAGAVAPTSGRVTVGGVEVDERRAEFRRQVAALIGFPPLARDLTIEEHLQLVAVSWGSGIAVARDIASKTLARLRIDSLRARFPHELSSGQSQLFSLAIVLARPFDVLLLDEPEQRLDVDRLALVTDVLRELAASGKTIVIATHSASLADQMADSTVVLSAEFV
jgi:ABC-type multidrug transport system ATPase subunit